MESRRKDGHLLCWKIGGSAGQEDLKLFKVLADQTVFIFAAISVRKWQTLIEAHVDVKTTDNYSLRMFCIAFTKRMPNQVKRTCYAQSSQIRQIRRKMREIMINQASSCDLKELVLKFIPEVIGKEIEKATTSIYPLQNVFIRKVKILKAPKFDLGKLMEVHGDYKEDIGVKVDRPSEDVSMEVEAEVVGA
ncbi:hypothetical protein KSP39_PZI005078 [Platanthera zijinensis]|uniref:40S ribosomal protein S3a n=1 Tax=Platanthera zijinensis TaxID=2320716 RepID=A0AAP0BTC8_9ASPA